MIRVLHGRIFLLIFIAVVSCACSYRSEPELALQAYIDAVHEERCDAALDLVSARSRHGLEVLRVKPQHPQSPLPIEEYYCRKLIFEDCKWGKMKVDEQNDDTAKVSMPCGRTQDSFLPGFTSPFLKYEPLVTELVREEGSWHVVIPIVIRIAEIREKEDQMRDEALRREQQIRIEHGLPPTTPRAAR